MTKPASRTLSVEDLHSLRECPKIKMSSKCFFGYGYAFPKVRSAGLPGLPVSRGFFWQNFYFPPVYAIYADRTTYAFRAGTRNTGLSVPPGLIRSLYPSHKTP